MRPQSQEMTPPNAEKDLSRPETPKVGEITVFRLPVGSFARMSIGSTPSPYAFPAPALWRVRLRVPVGSFAKMRRGTPCPDVPPILHPMHSGECAYMILAVHAAGGAGGAGSSPGRRPRSLIVRACSKAATSAAPAAVARSGNIRSATSSRRSSKAA